MLFKGQGKTPAKPPKASSKPVMSAKGKKREEAKEKESAIDSEEFADMVFDIDYSKHLLDKADEFLENKTDYSGKTTNSKVSFIDANKQRAFDRIPTHLKRQRNKERLDPQKQQRYDELLKHVEENLDSIVKEKKLFNMNPDSLSVVSGYTAGSNVYSLAGEQKSILESIDQRIRQCNPDAQILPLPNMESSLKQGFDKSLLHRAADSDTQSQFSMPVSGISRRSDFTTITLQQPGVAQKLPGEKSLRDKAVKRQTQARMMEIERHLKNIRQSDDLSYTDTNTVDITTIKTDDNRRLIDEETLLRLLDDCKDEEARFSIMDEGQQPHQMISRQQNLTAIELDHFDEVARRLQEAEKSVLDVVKIADEAS